VALRDITLQQTLANPFLLEGIGIHTGAQSRIVVHPAEPDTGRRFEVGGVTIPARADFVVDTARCTTLGHEGVRVSTVEHLLSALQGCGIDNARIEVFGPESSARRSRYWTEARSRSSKPYRLPVSNCRTACRAPCASRNPSKSARAQAA
jgi:hypothetical protein